jgi:hypothetical protein
MPTLADRIDEAGDSCTARPPASTVSEGCIKRDLHFGPIPARP